MRNKIAMQSITVMLTLVCLAAVAVAASVEESLPLLQRVGKQGEGHEGAMKAWQVVAAAPAAQLPVILSAMPDDNPLAANWIRAAVDAVAERTLKSGQPLPTAALDTYLGDLRHSSRSRRLAFEWLVKVDPAARERWIPQLLDDPSLELRREAVARQLEKGAAAAEAEQTEAAVDTYSTALQYARDIDQIEIAYDELRKLGKTVDLPKHFGFITNWHLIGPFDNTDTSGFDRPFPPEENIDLDGEYAGKDVVVRWQEAESENAYGKLDLNQLLGKANGVTAYAVAEFVADQARPVDLRLGCINANKVWLNGQLLIANHVYHSGSSIDQYVGQGELKAGKNTILVKICQNEQTESWAQDWEFQLRVCDSLGTAILSAANTQ